jgi:peptide/nickel transport system substrate-binding protein
LGGGAAAGAGLAGLALVGCGDDDDKASGGTTPAPGGTKAPAGSPSAQAQEKGKPGGTARYPLEGTNSGDPPTLYPFENISYLAQHPSSAHYSRLLKGQSGPNVQTEDNSSLEGDVVEKLPEQPDPATYIMKLRPNAAFHDKAPVNGRAMTAQDVVKAYNVLIAVSGNANKWKTVVDKFEATDEKTVKITLKAPFAPFAMTHLSSAEGLWIIPQETVDNDQVKKDPVGSGPWVFRQYDKGVAMRWDRNPKWHGSTDGSPFFDRIEASLNSDPQRIVAGLASGELDWSHMDATFYNDAKSKLDPKGMFNFEQTAVLGGAYFNFDNKPWQDPRVRQALSMSIDRDGLLKLLDQTGKGKWQSHISPALAPFYVDPKDEKAFGANAKYFKYDPAEAKKLLTAAGFPDGVKMKITANVDRYGEAARLSWEAIAASIKAGGFTAELVYQEYASYIQSTFVGKIPDGIGLGPLIGSPRDPDDIFYSCFDTTGARHNWGGTPIPEQKDLEAMFAKQRTILNLDERKKYLLELQQKMAESMLVVPYTGSALFKYFQPWVKGMYVKNGYPWHTESIAKAWFTDDRIKKG